ncbi:MAG: hypothetical protein LBG58_06295 [Planctomycetaceae bacterium]|nr:hypothetical protein [Planctomycetaceae bacterium]
MSNRLVWKITVAATSRCRDLFTFTFTFTFTFFGGEDAAATDLSISFFD